MLFAVSSQKDLKKDEVDQEFVALSDNGRVAMKTPVLEIDEALTISKALIHRTDSFSLRTDLVDIGIYVMSHWIAEFVSSTKKISSIRADLVPYLIGRQFQPTELVLKAIPALEHRRKPLSLIEPWLARSSTSHIPHSTELVDFLYNSMVLSSLPMRAPSTEFLSSPKAATRDPKGYGCNAHILLVN
jgi:hypothetical protein